MKRSMKLQILMAGKYEIPTGKKIDFSFDPKNKLYIASCEMLEFGIARCIVKGQKEDLETLGTDFSGIVLHVDTKRQEMEVKVFKKKKCKKRLH